MSQEAENRKYFKVETPDDYYQKELDVYYNWRFAWGREIGQNSLDAGAKNIDIRISPADSIPRRGCEEGWTDSTCWVEWTDDGCGMDRSDGEGGIIVFSKFLVLGASQKKNGDTGGFGWAKKLICFAMVEWHIRTGTLHIHGKGGTYWVEENLERIEGTKMRIRVPQDQGALRRNIEKWLKWTDTKGCKVKIDGRPTATFADIKVRGARDIPNVGWAMMTVTEEPGSKVIIRANGQMMSSMDGGTDQKTVVIIEVIGKSINHFTSNRDSLRKDSKKQINSFIQELFKNPLRITKLEKPICTTFVGPDSTIKIGDCSPSPSAISLAELLASGIDLIKMLSLMGTEDIPYGGKTEGFDIHIHNEMEGREIPERFLPGSWDSDAVELMAKFCAIIKFVGEVIGFSGHITPGWVFSPGVSALQKQGHILLNPIFIDEKTWEISDRFDNGEVYSDWNSLVKTVIHELTHSQGYRSHNIAFILKMSENFAIVLDNAEDLQALRDTFYGV